MKRILKFLGIGLVACLALAVIGTLLTRNNAPASPVSSVAAPKVQVTLLAESAKTAVTPVSTEATESSAPTVAPESTPIAEPTTAPAAVPAEFFLGDVVEQNGVTLVALQVEDPATPGMLYTAETDKKLVAVEVIIGNDGADSTSVNPLNASLVDTEGFAYQVELGGRDGQIASLNIENGERARGWISFKVPTNAKPASLKYKPALFGGDVIQASLVAPPEGHTAIGPTASRSALQLTKLGEVTEANGMSLSAVKVVDPATPGMLYSAHEGMKLVAVEVVLGNSGIEKVGSNPLYFYLVDNQGFVYAAELAGTDNQIDALDLAKGEKAKGIIAFTIPADATAESIKYVVPFTSDTIKVGLS